MPVVKPRRKQAEVTRARILAAAAERFAELGFPAARLADVGEAVGIGRSAVLYHFTDKRQLYRAVLDDLFGGLLVELRSALTAAGTLAERLEAAVGAFVGYMGRHPAAARIAVRESVNPDPELRAEIQRQAGPFLALLESTFEEGERTGAFRSVRSDPLHFASSIAGATLFYVAALPTLVARLPYDPLSRDQLEAHERDLIAITRRLLGIRGPKAVPAGRDDRPGHPREGKSP